MIVIFSFLCPILPAEQAGRAASWRWCLLSSPVSVGSRSPHRQDVSHSTIPDDEDLRVIRKYRNMNFKDILLLCWLISQASCLEVTRDGGYSEVVVRLEDSLHSQNCSVILDNIESFLASSSSSLFSALAGKFYQSQNFLFYIFVATLFTQWLIDSLR